MAGPLVYIPSIIVPYPIPTPSPLPPATYQALDLGSFIFASNPYEAGIPPKNTWAPDPAQPGVVNPPSTVQLVTNPTDIADVTKVDPPYMLNPPGCEMHEKTGQWKFKYADHYVARAVRVPYMYYQKSKSDPKTGILIRDYFLIGFEGGMGY